MRRQLWILASAALLVAGSALAQVVRPPMGGSDQFIGPPSGTVQDFLGTWSLSWAGPPEMNCPCQGTLTVTMDQDGLNLDGIWQKKGPNAAMFGPVSYDQNVWAGRYSQPPDELGIAVQGHFRLEVVDTQTLSGSYQQEGMAIAFTWQAKRQ